MKALRRSLGTRIRFVRSPSVQLGNINCFGKLWQLGEGVVCVWQEGGCVAGWTHALCLVGRNGQHIFSGSNDKLVKVWSLSARKEVAMLAGHAALFCRSPSVQMGNISFLEKSWQVGEGVVCLWWEGGCVAGWTRGLFFRSPLMSQSRPWATCCFGKWGRVGEGVVVNGTLLLYYISHYF
jgi:hypothetical protein